MDRWLDRSHYFNRGRKDLAFYQDYNKALVNNMRGIKMTQELKLSYHYQNFYEQKGLIEIAQGEKAKSVKSLRKALNSARKYNSGPICEQLGISLLELKFIEEAKNEFEKAFNLGYRSGKMDFYWGLCYERLNEKQKALKKYRLSEKQIPFFTCFGRNHYRVIDMINRGRYKIADKECKFLIKINQDFVYAYFNRVIVLLCQKRFDKGVRVFHYAYSKLPNIYPKEKKIVKKYKKYLRKSKEQVKEVKDEKCVRRLERKIRAIEHLLFLFDEHSPQKTRLYTVYLPNIVLFAIGFLVIAILLLLLFYGH